MKLDGWLSNETNHPMYVVTTSHQGRRHGCLVGFATQCSIDPLRFAVFLSPNNATFRAVEAAGALGVHILPRGRRSLAELFGAATGDDIDKFEACAWSTGPLEAPILQDALSWFAGRVVDRWEVGDHVGLVVEPVEGRARPGNALGFQEVRGMQPGHPP